jgi:predicted nucleic acid-binding protein
VRVLLDTNVILDVWLAREPFLRDSARILSGAEKGEIKGVICPTTVTTLHFLVKKEKGDAKARTLINELIQICEVGKLSRSEIQVAVESRIRDFEDAVIEAVAIDSSVDVIATRNLPDFKHSRVLAKEPSQIKW